MSTPAETMASVVAGAVVYLPEPAPSTTTPAAPRVVVARGSDLRPSPVRWLWKHWLALGKLAILAGSPGQGKTTIALSLAATVTSGGTWPDGSACSQGSVLIWSGEDDPADTLLPRLLAAGAHADRCYFVQGTRIAGELEPFDPARDMPELEAVARSVGDIRLLIVDPVVSAVAGDDHKNSSVRRSLQPLVDLASHLDLAILGISHFSKGGAGSDPASRVVGSIAYSAVARIVLVASKLNKFDSGDKRIFARAKSNIGPDDGGFEYRIDQRDVYQDINASYIEWGDSVEGNARDLLAEDDEEDDKNEAASDDISEMLKQELVGDCWTPSEPVVKAIEKMGFNKKQVWKASKKIGVLRKKGGMHEGWYWRLPVSSTDSEGAI